MNILLLMAGAGSRFAGSDYDLPKPLIEIDGRPMYEHAIESLGLNGNVVVVSRFRINDSRCLVINVDKVLDGPALSALMAKKYINNNEELIIMNSDQMIDWSPSDLDLARPFDGGLLLFRATGNRWSFAKVVGNRVVEVAEKDPISQDALVGIHYWKRGKDFVKYAEKMISKNDRVNNEFYIAPVYNYAISDGLSIVPIYVNKMYDLGTPEALDTYLRGRV